jgi:hypothetical protein
MWEAQNGLATTQITQGGDAPGGDEKMSAIKKLVGRRYSELRSSISSRIRDKRFLQYKEEGTSRSSSGVYALNAGSILLQSRDVDPTAPGGMGESKDRELLAVIESNLVRTGRRSKSMSCDDEAVGPEIEECELCWVDEKQYE